MSASKLVLQPAFCVCLRWSSDPEMLHFMIFTERWGCTDLYRFSTARDYNATASGVSGLLQDMLVFAGEQLVLFSSEVSPYWVSGLWLQVRCIVPDGWQKHNMLSKCPCFVHGSTPPRGRRMSSNVYLRCHCTSRLVQRPASNLSSSK